MPSYSQKVDLNVGITVNSKPVTEFIGNNATQGSNMITRYIEATAGTEFEMAYLISGLNTTNQAIRVSCYVDGTVVRKPTHRPQGHLLWRTSRVIGGVLELHANVQTIRAMRFSNIASSKRIFTVGISTICSRCLQ
jgi:hypothetical protein